MVVAREKGMANQVSPPDMKPHTPCKFDLTVKIISFSFFLLARKDNLVI